jgi:hypothetical protein
MSMRKIKIKIKARERERTKERKEKASHTKQSFNTIFTILRQIWPETSHFLCF